MPLFRYFPFFTFLLYTPAKGNQPEERHNLYIEEHQNYINAIHEALKTYEETSCENCSCYDNVIANDLAPFKDGITKELLGKTYTSGVKYQVINNKVYRRHDCLFPSRCEGVDYFLNKIRNELPDVEFVVNFHDWPQVNRHFNLRLPVFSFSKTDSFFDIMYPAWSFWKGGPAIKIYPVGIGKWEEHRKKIIEMSDKWPWEKKLNIAFFRGSRTSSERDNLIRLSRSDPTLLDAAYTKNQAWKSDKDTLNAPAADEIPLEDHCRYRYLFNFRGVAASFRLKYLFLCKSLVFHVGNEWKEFFYDNLKPWIHYIPVDSNYTQEQYKKLLLFVKHEEEIAKQIAERGYNFVKNNLKITEVICYWKKLLLAYSALLTFSPVLDDTLANVTT
ncbi:O-glucosyltransferase rumi homolog [Cimex lectularius]|uniref:Glycosyl transferase CAP10 domain-containing protein n=1 Tax=Cimex lectularius TaxID=79782 RepID=A0A8I6S7R9_CIMLE|nr:O-glucosyltransferase rumi homolog [Cimex lectularius]